MLTTPGGRPYAAPGVSNHGAFTSRRPYGDHDDNDNRASGSYRTICVRTCDGFYFPISNSTSKKGFYRDDMKCRSQCGEDARIFYLPSKTTDVDGAVDLQGRAYGRTATAYVYRKTLVGGCKCKPDPWSQAELARHQRYADAELDTKRTALPTSDAPTDVTIVAADKSTDPTTVEEYKIAAVVPKTRSTGWKTVNTQIAPKAPRQPQKVASKVGQGSAMFGAGMGLGSGQLTWPGDGPRRP